ncbi:MAG: ABC transporter ATP-binding protein [Bacteroidota bacterium]
MNHILKNIFSILTRKEGKKFVKLILLDVAVSVLDIVFLVALLYVVGFYTRTYHPEKMGFITSPIFEHYPLLLITAFFLFFSLKNLFGFLVTRMQFRFVYDVASGIAVGNLNAYLETEYTDYVAVDSSVHIRKISQQPVEFSHYVLRGVQQIISNVLLVLLTIIPIIIFSSNLFLLLFLVLLPPVGLTIYLTKKKLALIRQSNKLNREKTMQHLQEALSGFIEINIYQQKSFFLNRYKIFQEKFNASLAELQVVQSLPPRLMEVFAVFGLFILVTASSIFGGADSLQVLLIGGFMAAAYKIIPGIVKIVNSREQVRTYSFTIDDLLKARVAVKDVKTQGSSIKWIECRDISFTYKEELLLKNFSMSMEAGDFIGLSGNSGAGKTTILHLLLGFLDPLSGSILINGEFTDADGRKGYWDKIAYAKQQPFFIHESIKTNIVLDRDIDEQKFTTILSVTGVDKFVDQYREGINTVLAENGKNISGGQRQRIILARALYNDADLLILDEPFNELDRESVDQLLNYLAGLARSGKIVLLVTHDAESLAFCNKIIRLDEK